MTDKMTVHPLKHMAKIAFSAKVALATLISACVLAQAANAAEQEWWFDVEVILFERNLDKADISEKFKQSRLDQPSSDVLDLLTPYLKPDLSYLQAGLTYCRASKQHAVKQQYEQDFAFPLPVVESNEPLLTPAKEQLEQGNQALETSPEILAKENFEYEVATTDIFAQSNEKVPLTQTADAEETLEPDNSDNIEKQENLDSPIEINLPSPPIYVDFIEWQVPSVFPCAYAEQIDPSFATVSPLQISASAELASDQIKRVPEIINGIEWQQKRSAFLLPTSNMYMKDLYDKIKKQRDIKPMLHLNWRQQVKFGRKNGQTIRLFAGDNFANQFDVNGLPLDNDTDPLFANLQQPRDDFYVPEQEIALLSEEQLQTLLLKMNDNDSKTESEDLFTRIDTALADDTPIIIEHVVEKTEQSTDNINSTTLKELWQLDGGITVYLRNVGRIPYLHIDSHLDFRFPIFDANKAPKEVEELSNDMSEHGAISVNQLTQPSTLQPSSLQPNFLQSANFNQLRRVISKQVHYFDHPLFGMIVRISRYRWPEEPSDGAESDEQDN
jgi:hypothetical protein